MDSYFKVVTAIPTLDTNAYADGDRMGSVVTLTNALGKAGGTAKVVSVNVIDRDKQNIVFDILLFNELPTVASADNAAIDLADAQADKIVGVIPIATGDYTTAYANNSQATKANVNLLVSGLQAASGVAASSNLYMLLVSRGAPTHTASGLVIKLGLEVQR